MPRGGKRPGAGAPRGNLNAFKHGQNSKQYRRLLQIVAADPEARDLLTQLALRRRDLQKRHHRDANRLLDHIANAMLDHARNEATALYERNQTIPPPPDTNPYP